MDFETRRKRLAASPDEDECIGNSRWRTNEARIREAFAVQIEHADEEVAELGIVGHPIFSQCEGEPLPSKVGLPDDSYFGHRRPSLASRLSKNERMRPTISSAESSC